MANGIGVEEMRMTLARVAAYRKVCDHVRSGASSTMFTGALFLGFAYLNYSMMGKFHPILYGQIILGVGELLVGIWKKFRPSPECVLLDGILISVYVASIVIRQYMLHQAGFAFQPVSIMFGVWFGFNALNTFRAYGQLRNLFVERPTAEHLAYVDGLVEEIRASSPETESSALDLPTYPQLKVKLLGEIAFVVDTKSGELSLFGRDDFDIERIESSVRDKPPIGSLTIDGQELPEFTLSDANWANYTKWKNVSE
jgi:ABC-type thiamin/hydroxymethylpyrimidine transport system permease subunit